MMGVIDQRYDRLHTIVRALNSDMSLRVDGPHRAGETDVAKLLHDDVTRRSGPVRFPGDDRYWPWDGYTQEQKLAWMELVTVCTLLDNVEERRALLNMAFSAACNEFRRQLTRYSPDTFHAVTDVLERHWEGLREIDRRPVLNEDTFPTLLRSLLLLATANPAANEHTFEVALNVPEISLMERTRLLEGDPPETIWERMLFDLRWDVSRHKLCPPHLADLTGVVT